jgi:hypothetical protein
MTPVEQRKMDIMLKGMMIFDVSCLDERKNGIDSRATDRPAELAKCIP